MNRGTLGKVQDGWGEPARRSGPGQGTLKEVGGKVGVPSGRSGTGRGIIGGGGTGGGTVEDF